MRRCPWGRGKGRAKGRDTERRRCLTVAHPASCERKGWHGDSVDSTTLCRWSAACPFWLSAACGLNRRTVIAGAVSAGANANKSVFSSTSLTQGQSVGALGGNGEGDDEMRARGVHVDEGGTVSSERQHAADHLHHLRGVVHRPVKHTPSETQSLIFCISTQFLLFISSNIGRTTDHVDTHFTFLLLQLCFYHRWNNVRKTFGCSCY